VEITSEEQNKVKRMKIKLTNMLRGKGGKGKKE